MRRHFVRRWAIGAATLVAAASMIGLSTDANAADPDENFPGGYFLSANFPTSGTAHVAKGNFDVPLGPTTLKADIGFNGDNTQFLFYASLPLPPKTVSFKAFGYLPVRAKVYFTQVGPATGTIDLVTPDGKLPLTAEAKYVVTLRDVYVGYTAANVGDNCQTRYPIDVNISDPDFQLLSGGNLSGGFDLGKFNNCRTSTDLANLIVPSIGNTVKLHLGEASLPSADSPAAVKRVKALAAKH